MHDVGPCQTSIDKTLKELGVDCQAYFGGSIIGNHCDKMLKDANIDVLCSSIPVIIESNIHNVADLYQNALICCEKFSVLVKKYGKCRRIFNSSKMVDVEKCNELEGDIINFMAYLRLQFPQIQISPKLHMLEDHVNPFLQKWGAPCGFYGEQGGESIHKTINSMKHNYRNVRNNVERLTYVMRNHLAATNPNADAKRVTKKKRRFQRDDE